MCPRQFAVIAEIISIRTRNSICWTRINDAVRYVVILGVCNRFFFCLEFGIVVVIIFDNADYIVGFSHCSCCSSVVFDFFVVVAPDNNDDVFC